MMKAALLYAALSGAVAGHVPALPNGRAPSPPPRPLTLAEAGMPGTECSSDADCRRDTKCVATFEGPRSCILSSRACALRGHIGTPVGGRITRQDRCYRCDRDGSWKPC